MQQSAYANAHEEVAGYGDADQVSATPGLGSSLEAPRGGEDEGMPADTPDSAVLEQSVSQLSAADPAEASTQLDSEPMVQTPAPSPLGEAAELSVDQRIDVFLEAIRNRSWEQTGRQPVKWADGAKPDIQLPPSGYSEIGGTGSGTIKGQMLNPGRTFYPGQAYEPEVSNPCLGSDVAVGLAIAWIFVQGWLAGVTCTLPIPAVMPIQLSSICIACHCCAELYHQLLEAATATFTVCTASPALRDAVFSAMAMACTKLSSSQQISGTISSMFPKYCSNWSPVSRQLASLAL